MLAWPAIRLDVFWSLIGDLLYRTDPLVNFARAPDLRRICIGAARAAVHNLLNQPQHSEILLLATGAGLIPQSGRWFNRHTDYFTDCLGRRAWTMEYLFGDDWPALPRTNGRLGLMADHRLELAIHSLMSVRASHRAIAGNLIDVAARRGRDLFGWELGEKRRSALIATAARRLAGYPVKARFATRLIGRIRPRMIIAEEGCYGHMAVFNAIARDLGVTVAEFQHGMVTKGHHAYNVAPRLARSAAYGNTQPAVFLSYGVWWGGQFNAPVDKRVVVGNPHRSESLRSWRPDAIRSNVVVLGDGAETDAYLQFCQRLAATVPSELRVVFRPHPVERARVGRSGHPSVSIDAEPDLYRSLATAGAVIGEASTALFEAVGLVPRVLVWDTDKSRFYLGDHEFERFSDVDELARALDTSDVDRLAGDAASQVWADNWQARFLDFVNDQA